MGVAEILSTPSTIAGDFTTGAVAAVVFAAYRVYNALPRLHALKLGRDGEKAVGQFLESLRGRGYRVFHDVVGGNFNLDHVLIGPTDVFIVETKTHSKPSGDARVVFDGETIRIDGFEAGSGSGDSGEGAGKLVTGIVDGEHRPQFRSQKRNCLPRLVCGLYWSQGKDSVGAQPQGVTHLS